MTEVGRKRKATRALEEATKRMRIEPPSTFEVHQPMHQEEESDENSDNSYEEDSDEPQSKKADTPLTPLSPLRKFPSDLKTIRCTYEGCNKSFNRPARLAAHLRSHTNERPFACSYAGCDKTYIEEKHLKQHVKGSHTHEKLYQCDWNGCSKSFLTATRLRRHRDAHEGHDRFRCTSYPPCTQTFRKHQTLQRHIRANHLELAPFPCTYVDSTTQVACNAGFDSGTALRKHGDRVHGAFRFWCDECSASGIGHDRESQSQAGFRTKNELTKHIRDEHSNCLFCDIKCMSQVELQRHIETQHSNNGVAKTQKLLAERKMISCSFPGCSKTFTKNFNLNVHIRSAHDGQRFTCSATSSNGFKSPDLSLWTGTNACGRDFVSQLNLEDHIRTQHLGLRSVLNAKKLRGPSSGNKKREKTSLKEANERDIINVLTGAGYASDPARNIPCTIPNCPWLFTRKYDLTLHLQSAHYVSAFDTNGSVLSSLSQTVPCDTTDRRALETMYDQAELEWDAQRSTAATAIATEMPDNEDSPFWIGARDEEDEEDLVEANQDWAQEQEEMRRLCDHEGEWDGVLDPELRGI